MFEVRVEDDFAAAHFLKDYHGKCENLHGHNYKVFVHVEGNSLDEGGMLIDFSVLKRELKNVLSCLDHTNLNDIQFFAERTFNRSIRTANSPAIKASYRPRPQTRYLSICRCNLRFYTLPV